jgi:glycerophosphoryl diester phosphodiesterase
VAAWRTLDGTAPRIIAHRGASGYLPEHTMAGYMLAVRQGADVIEPDLVLSRDGVPYARHDLFLSRSTDIASRPEFARRAREHEGRVDWWVGDFDAAELDRLRAVQRYRHRDHGQDGYHPLVRFAQILDYAQSVERPLAVYPEIKHPDYFHALGLDPVQAVLDALQARGLAGPASPVWLQCFDRDVLRDAHRRCGNPCFALFEDAGDCGGWIARLHELGGWASGIAPDRRFLWHADGSDSGLVGAAHVAGLQVHAWTFRDDADAAPFNTSREAMRAAMMLGTDALFCDFPDTAVACRRDAVD